MDGELRRINMLKLLQQSKKPISGSILAKQLNVSRQVIVQDIALLRANNKNIMSTNKGYLLFQKEGQEGKVTKTIKVTHTEDEILDELYTIVDYGVKVLDVVVEHAIYGQIMVDLIINSRADAKNFVEQVKKSKTKPLNELTQGIHYHTVIADNEDMILQMEEALLKKNYLLK